MHSISRGTKMLSIHENYIQLQEAVQVWAPIREKAIEDIEEKITDLIRKRRNTSIAKIAGATTSIGGSILAVVGFALTPVTFGASLGLGIGGAAIATAGGITVAGSSLADIIIQRCQKEVQAILKEDFEKLEPIRELAKEILKIVQEIEERCEGIDKKAIFEFIAVVIAPALVKGRTIDAKVVETMLGALEIHVGAAAKRVVHKDVDTAARLVVTVAVVVLSAQYIPMDMILMGVTLKNIIADKNQSRATDNLWKSISKLQKQKAEILKTTYTKEAQL